jgi:hypothetical protein
MDADPQASSEISARLLICFGFDFFAFVVQAATAGDSRGHRFALTPSFGVADACSAARAARPGNVSSRTGAGQR